MAIENLTHEAATLDRGTAVLFEQIAELADVITALAADAINDSEFATGKMVAIRELAGKAGFLSDFGSSRCGGDMLKGEAFDWMLCPAYHDAVKAVEVCHV